MGSTIAGPQATAKRPATTSASVTSGVLQRQCACGRHTIAGGECEECRKKRRFGLQTKLKVNEPEDIYEQEAVRIADQVMAMPAHPAVGSTPLRIQRFSGQSNEQMDAAPASVDQALASAGSPLEPVLRQDMEQRFGHDFSRVRVHTGTEAAKSAEAVNALAYTVGRDIVWGATEYASLSTEGRYLLAHELTHVLQQSGGETMIQRAPAADIRWKRDVNAARYRGQVMAKRIRTHTKLSKEAQAKINSELAYFEGAAKEAYIKEVRPALLAVVETQMPEMRIRSMRVLGPPRLSLLTVDPYLCGASKCFTDEDIYAPTTELELREKAEREREVRSEISRLMLKTKDWLPEDRKFALEQLSRIFSQAGRTNIDPRAVSRAIRQPILDLYERLLRAQDEKRLQECPKLSLLEKIRRRNVGDEPCESWFKYRDGPGPLKLQQLRTQLMLAEGTASNPVDQVVLEVEKYRYETDPNLLWQREFAMAGLSVVTAAAGGPKGGGPPRIGVPRGGLPPKPVPSEPVPSEPVPREEVSERVPQEESEQVTVSGTAEPISEPTPKTGGVPEPISEEAVTQRTHLGEETGEVVGEFRIAGDKALKGQTFERNIWGLKNIHGKTGDIRPIMQLSRDLIREARAAGATELKIIGDPIDNENVLGMQRIVGHFGGTSRRTGPRSIEIIIPLR